MIFLKSMVFVFLFILLCGKVIRKQPIPFYIAAVIIAAAIPALAWSNSSLPSLLSEWILPVFLRGGIAGAFFIIVMITGAFPNGSAPIKYLMPIRGQLSIIASILTFGHNIAYGKIYFVKLFTAPDTLSIYQCAAAICSLLMLLIIIPLFVTSFTFIRKKMKAKKWKKLQRLAYVFYALLCMHILLINLPSAVSGRKGYRLTVFVYGVIFLSYAVCRILKSIAVKNKKTDKLVKRQTTGIVFCIIIILVFVSCLNVKTKENSMQDGVYSGSGMGMNGEIIVNVTISDGKITDIVIVSQQDDEPYITDALEVIEHIIAQNSTEVDTISGATYSSGGIIDAVTDAVMKK